MRGLRSNRGAGLVDIMVTLLILSIAGVVFSACFPTGFSCSRRSQEYKLATAIAQRKMDQLRVMNYESLTEPLLHSAGIIDTESSVSPYSFTSVDSLDAHLTGGSGTIAIDDMGSALRLVQVTVRWQSRTEASSRSVQLTTVFADKRTRALN